MNIDWFPLVIFFWQLEENGVWKVKLLLEKIFNVIFANTGRGLLHNYYYIFLELSSTIIIAVQGHNLLLSPRKFLSVVVTAEGNI